MSLAKLFWISVLVGVAGTSIMLFAQRPRPSPVHPPVLTSLADGVFVTAQLTPASFGSLNAKGIRSVVDMRPDDEEKGQPSSREMSFAAKRHAIGFTYIPVPHEAIPAKAVDDLTSTLAKERKPVVLYCRSGRRAVRLFALSEASRENGPSAAALQKVVHDAGFSAKDLSAEIEQRIVQRQQPRAEP